MANTHILHVPTELRPEIVTSVCVTLLNTKREFLNDIINQVDGIFLSMPVIDFQRTYARDIIMAVY